jgi:FemAB-related protein (PEP-CTERM system-associated)
MRITLATESDQQPWDDFVSSQPDASPYQRFAWKQAIEESYHHPCFYFIARDEQENVLGILPTVFIKPPLLAGKLCSLPFCDRGEALATTPDTAQMLLDKALEIARNKGVTYEYRATSPVSEHVEGQTKNGKKVRMLLELPESSEALMKGFKAKLRSQIRKAEKNGLIVETGRSEAFINDFFHVFTINMKDLGSPTHSRQWFEAILKHYGHNIIISIVRYNGTPVGAGIVLLNAEMAAIPWASTIRAYNKLAPNMLLYWSLLEYASNHGSRFFDFGRSSYGEGTFRFKQQWGARPVALEWKTYLNNTVQHDSENSQVRGEIRSLIEDIWRRLPLPVTVFIGSKTRKYISL